MPWSTRYLAMISTAPLTSTSSVLMWISGFGGASYGAEIPVNSNKDISIRHVQIGRFLEGYPVTSLDWTDP